MDRYSEITNKNQREIVLLKAFPCVWGKCSFCDYILDNSNFEDEINKLNFEVLENITGKYKVLEVINELKVDLDGVEKNSFKDFFIRQTVKFKLLTTRNIKSQNYTIVVENGTVYIIGIAEDEIEIQKVGYLASTVSGVDNVIVHVIEKNDSRRVLE